MTKKTRVLGAAFAALAFSLLFVSTGLAKQDYSITATKTADNSSLAAGGGTVTWTVAVTNDGTKDFNFTGGKDLVVSDTQAGCTLEFDSSSDGSGPEGKGKDGKLGVDATWWYTCTMSVTKTTTNCATADASHDSSGNHEGAVSPETCATVTVGTVTATIDTTGTSAAMLALVLLAIGGLGFLGTTNRLPKLPKFR